MKLFFVFLMLSTSLFAGIPGSSFEKRHQDLIVKAIDSQCGILRNLEQLSSEQKIIVIDQGIQDVEYSTVLRGFMLLDQGVFDSYIVTVKSEFGDFYDHDARDWGHYSVSSVRCEVE